MRGKRECSDVLKAIVAICGFPVVLVLYLLYYVFVVPIQQIVKIVSINKMHESQAYYTEDPSVFEQKALTYVVQQDYSNFLQLIGPHQFDNQVSSIYNMVYFPVGLPFISNLCVQ
ncbi:Hypothetical_protein [Hexamita inflata]|uniref:Hypothetical_protein n=1 Tax=Hexamita inflata TaxID=28002 RepID=A0AA86PH63_9EUKA|nr:Hypothetical protein HINF_LOCUS23422 [Hexamita inflata]